MITVDHFGNLFTNIDATHLTGLSSPWCVPGVMKFRFGAPMRTYVPGTTWP